MDQETRNKKQEITIKGHRYKNVQECIFYKFHPEFKLFSLFLSLWYAATVDKTIEHYQSLLREILLRNNSIKYD